MTTVLAIVVVLAALWALAFVRVPLPVSTALILLLLIALTLWAGLGVASLLLLWLLFLLIAIPLNVTPLRRQWFTTPALKQFRRIMPTMSRTEREALEAGTVWWEGELFSGRPDWKRLLDLPAPGLSAEEQAFIDGPLDELCRLIEDWRITDELHDLPPEVWRFIKDKGFFGMIIPRQYGGLGFSALAHSTVVMTLSTRSISSAVTVMVPNSLGPAELLLHYGTQAQKDHYLPRLASGEEVPCFALTGPEAGSDAAGMPDRGVVCKGDYNGEEIIGIRLNWEKRYITLGPVATVLGLAFKLHDPDYLLGDHEELGITLALIPTDTPGIEIGERHAPLNIAFQNGPNRGHDVFIPLDWIIGGRDGIGEGWRMLMESLAAGRSISLPSLATGAGKLMCRYTGAYARIRRQFRLPIGRFEGVEEVLARIAGNTWLMDAARIMTAQAVDQGEKPAVASAIVKYHLTERMRRTVNDAMDIQGGSGICMGPRNLIGRIYQAVPISITVEGANILTRSLIIFGQGAIRCHPYVLAEMRAATAHDGEETLKAFDQALFGHLGFLVSNAARALWLGLTGARLHPAPGSRMARPYIRRATRMSAAFALVADVAMLVLGGELKRREKLSGRLADVLSQLYLVSASLRHYEQQGSIPGDRPLMQWACEDSLYGLQEQLDDLLRNFPDRRIAWLLRLIVFPLGTRFRPPSDALGHEVAAVIMDPGPARDRLTAGTFLTDDTRRAIGRIDAALTLVVAAEPIEARLREALRDGRITAGTDEHLVEQGLAQGVVDADEAERYRMALAARRDVITVDAFPGDHWERRQAGQT